MSDARSQIPEEQGGAVDWAERLRASMNAETETETPASVTIPDEEDDLAALLRDQLARRSSESEAPVPLDTSEFYEEDPAEDLVEDDDEDPAEDYEEDLVEDDDEDPAEDYEEDLAEDDAEDDAEDYAEDYEEDLVEDDDEDYAEDYAEDYDEDPDEVEPYVADHEAPGVTRGASYAHHRTADVLCTPRSAERHTPDVVLNGNPDARGGSLEPDANVTEETERRRRLREENERLLSEIEHPSAAYVSSAARSHAAEEADIRESDAADEGELSEAVAHRPSAIAYDPLQSDYDAVKPTPRSHAGKVAAILDGECPVSPVGVLRATRQSKTSTYADDIPPDTPDEIHLRDTALLDELGYGAEMSHAEDRRAAEFARSACPPSFAFSDTADPTVLPVKVRGGVYTEYAGQKQTEEIRLQHIREKRGRVFRMIFAAAGVLLGLLWDLLPTVLSTSAQAGDYLSTVAYPLMALLWMTIFSLPFLSRLKGGLVGMCRLSPTRYTLSVVALLVHAVYVGIVSVAMAVDPSVSMPLFCGVTLCMTVVGAVSEWLDAMGEWAAFDMVSVGRPVYVLSDENTPAVAGLGDAGRIPPLTAVKTSLADHVFARMSAYNGYMGRLNYYLPCVLLAAILCAGVSLLQGGGLLADGLRIFVAVTLSLLPAAYLIGMSLPLFCTNRILARRGSAVIGASAPDVYAREGCEKRKICFADRDILKATRRKEITLRDGADGEDEQALPAEHWRRMANRLFHLLHSPLAIDIPFEDDGSSEALLYLHAEIAEQDHHYMKVYLIDETPGACTTTEIIMGSHDALSRRGIRLPRRSMEEVYRKSGDSHVVYLAFDGRFRIAYATEYRVDRAFADVSKWLSSCRAEAVMVTYDPMLTDEMLAHPRFAPLAGMEISRPDHVDIPRRTCSSGLVATRNGRDLVYPLLGCRRIKTCYRLSGVPVWLGLLLQTALAVFLILTGKDAALHTVMAFCLQTLLTVVTVAITLLTVNRNTLPTGKEQ